jgi:hypothetical protein
MKPEDCAALHATDVPRFPEIKAILDYLVLGKEDNLQLFHGNQFGWNDRAQLLAAAVAQHGHLYRLIDPAFVNNGKGRESLLVRVLSGPFQLDGISYPQMPHNGNINGDFATVDQLTRIALWIDSGCPE